MSGASTMWQEMAPSVPPTVLALDPGPTQSAWVIYSQGRIHQAGIAPNEQVLFSLQEDVFPVDVTHMAIEMIASYGMAVGREVFETCVWIGRFVQAWDAPYTMVYRREVKLHVCGSPKANDANIRRALLDRFGEQGTKKAPGVTYGLKKDMWSALGVAVTWMDRQAGVP